MTTPTVGDLVARRYEIRGAPRQFPGYMGYRAFDREVEVEVALWWVRPELYPGAADRAAFLRAAEVSRAMKNPNARRLFDAGEHDGGLFATVQLAAHQPKVATPTDAELLDRAVALCDALGRAHEDGFAHGRLVPDDVVHVNGLLKIGGIGLWGGASSAREVWGEAGRYVAPEAWSPGGVTPRADVFSAGVILAELASGGGSAWRRTGDVRDLADELALARADVAAELGAALALDPARRTPSMPALLAALRGALVDESLPTAQHLAVPPAEPGALDRLATDAGQLRGAPPEVSAIDRVADASADTRDYVKVAEHELDADDLLPIEDAPEAVAPAHAELPPPIAADDATRPFVRGAGEALQLPLAAGPPSVRMPAVVVPAQGARRERGLWPYVLAA